MIEGDSLVLINKEQVSKMNKVFVQLDSSIEINQSLNRTINNLEKIDSIRIKHIFTMQEREKNLKGVMDYKDKQINVLEESNIKKSEKIDKLVKTRRIYTVSGFLSGILLSYFLNK